MKKKRILLVDDESDITAALSMALVEYRFEVDSYNDPLAALSNFKPSYYDLVILDIKMPVMNGFELLREIKKVDESVKVCFLTALSEFRNYMPHISEVWSTLDENYIIRKPIGNKDLLRDITRIINSC
jgi:DNA-binding response OmpR family regulator